MSLWDAGQESLKKMLSVAEVQYRCSFLSLFNKYVAKTEGSVGYLCLSVTRKILIFLFLIFLITIQEMVV